MLIVYIVSFLKAFAFAGVAKQGKDAAVLALDNDAGGVDPPGVGRAVSVDSFFGEGEDATCNAVGESCYYPGEMPKSLGECCTNGKYGSWCTFCRGSDTPTCGCSGRPS